MESGDYIKYVFVLYYSNGLVRFRSFRSQTGTITYLKAKISNNEKIIDAIKNDCRLRKINIGDKNIDVNFKIDDLYVVLLPEDYPEISKLVHYDIGYNGLPLENFKYSKLAEEMLYFVNAIVQQLHSYYSQNQFTNIADYIAYLNYVQYAYQTSVNQFAYPTYNLNPKY